MSRPEYKRVVLTNTTRITPQIMKQLRDNQEWIRINHDKMPKGVLSQAIDDNIFIVTGPTTILSVTIDTVAGRLYEVKLTTNGVGRSITGSGANFAGEIRLEKYNSSNVLQKYMRVAWVRGDEQTDHYSTWGPIEALDFVTSDLADVTYRARAYVPADTNINTFSAANGPLKDGDLNDLPGHSLVGENWEYQATGNFQRQYNLTVRDCGAYSNDPWQYI